LRAVSSPNAPKEPAPTNASEVTAVAAAKAWKSRLPREFRTPSNSRGLILFAVSILAYVLTFIAMLASPFVVGVFAFGALNVLSIGAMFVVGHDAAHRTLVRSVWLNRVLGRIAMLPAWHPFATWVHAHNTLHHGWTGLKGKHPDFCPLSKEDYDALPSWRRAVERFYRSPFGIGACYVFEFYFKHLIWPTGERRAPNIRAARLDCLLVLVFVAVQFSVGAWLVSLSGRNLLPPYQASISIIATTWTIWAISMGMASYLQHTHPRTAWYDDIDEWNFYHVQLRSSTHVTMPAFVDRLIHNIMDHPAHHLDPTIPMYLLPQSQELLETHAGEHAVVVPWGIREFLRTCRVCKLYDYKNHCWTNFDGRPTSPSGLSGLPSFRKSAQPV
jgi:acyl-lipid omega-6 desaturase (Delta-12 desaturase)